MEQILAGNQVLTPYLEDVKAAVIRIKELDESKPELEILSDPGKEALAKVMNSLNWDIIFQKKY